MDIQELGQFESAYKPSKEVAFCWLRKQYVQLSTEEDHTEIANHANDSLRIWQAAKAQAVPEGFVLVEKKEFEQMQEFEDLYRRAIFNSKKSIHEVNWSHVSNLGVGSTRAKAMCKRFNIDPEATFRKPQEPTND